MNSTRKNNSGNAMLIGLIVLVLAAAAGAYFFYLKKPAPDALPDTPELTQTEEPAQTEPDIATDESGNAVPGTETEQAAPENAEAASIDVAAATGVRAVGNPNAPIKIIEFASLTCSHCAHFHNEIYPALKSKYIDTGKVYLEFREFPLNDPALKATLTARCLPADQYDSFVSLLFKTQDHWAGDINYMNSLKQNAKLAGMSDATFQACQEEPMLKLKIAENMQQAKDKWNISATPSFVINDGAEVISGARPLEEFERVFRKLTNDAVGEAPAVE